MYVDAVLEPPKGTSNIWKAVVTKVPNPLAHPNEQARLHLTAGELGRSLGMIELGSARGEIA